MWHGDWGGPCFCMTLKKLSWTLRVLKRMRSSLLFWSDWYSSTETFCSNRVQMPWSLSMLFHSLLCIFHHCHYLLHASLSPLATPQHLPSYLLFDSWHAECWLAASFIPSVFILFCTIIFLCSGLFLFLFRALNRIVVMLVCRCIVRCFIIESSFVSGFQLHKFDD